MFPALLFAIGTLVVASLFGDDDKKPDEKKPAGEKPAGSKKKAAATGDAEKPPAA